jgi:hypothetical protein
MQVPALFQPMSLGAGFGETHDLSPLDAGADVYPNVAIVDNAGNVNDQNGDQIISADAITRAAMTPGADVGQAVAQELQRVAPDWTKQFKDADSLVKAAYSLFNTSKAVIQGKPIPQTVQSPYVYSPNNPNVYRPTTTATTTQLSANTTNMLLIGGVALAAFLVLRKK